VEVAEGRVGERGRDGELVRHVEVALLLVHVDRVVAVRILHVVRDGRDGELAEEVSGEDVFPHGVVDEVSRPVDAHVLARLPRAVARVLLDDVELLARRRVDRPADVEVALDLVRRDDGAVRRLGEALLALALGPVLLRDALVVLAVGDLVGLPADQHVLGDLPPDAIDVAPRSDADERLARGRVDDVVSPVELRIVAGIVEPLADEEVLAHRVGLHAIDRIALLCAADRHPSKQPAQGQARHEPSHDKTSLEAKDTRVLSPRARRDRSRSPRRDERRRGSMSARTVRAPRRAGVRRESQTPAQRAKASFLAGFVTIADRGR
jgi:hypothetical protein